MKHGLSAEQYDLASPCGDYFGSEPAGGVITTT